MIIIGKLTDFKISADPPPAPLHMIGLGRAYYRRIEPQTTWAVTRFELPPTTDKKLGL